MKKHKRSVSTTLQAMLYAMMSMAVAISTIFGVTMAAHAAPLRIPDVGTYLVYRVDGTPLYIGAVATSDQGHAYCIEAGAPAEQAYAQAHAISSSQATRNIAWLAQHYKDSRDANIHAAIGVLAHRNFDRNPQIWQQHWQVINSTYPHLDALAAQLWQEASQATPEHSDVRVKYTEGLRNGTVQVSINNAEQQLLADIPYTVTLEGPAQFEGGGMTRNGRTQEHVIEHAWVATAQGEVKVHTVYDEQALESLESEQDYVRFAGSKQVPVAAVSFQVKKNFNAHITSQITPTMLATGQEVHDEITLRMNSDTDAWHEGLKLPAKGWYFNGIDPSEIGKIRKPQQGQTAASFLQSLAADGFKPVAYAKATFDKPNQPIQVTAMSEPNGSTPYTSPNTIGFGTWVWAIERSQLSKEAQEYVLEDIVSDFLEVSETHVAQTQLKVFSHVYEHSVRKGAPISDTITVSGFPFDHGDFKGSQAHHIDADEPYAQVAVWWSGGPGELEQYRPHTKEEPQEDEHHKLLGQWDFPAKNGRYIVGMGQPDAHGKPIEIAATQRGWISFVWKFKGDSRVEAFSSDYNDPWEQVMVDECECSPTPVSITTHTSTERVHAGEDFYDIAEVTGVVPEGSYVLFELFAAVEMKQAPHENGKIEEFEVPLDPFKENQQVKSPASSSESVGIVHYRASVRDKEGKILASHDLGAPHEEVTIYDELPEEPLPVTGSNTYALVVTMSTVLAAALCVACYRYKEEEERQYPMHKRSEV